MRRTKTGLALVIASCCAFAAPQPALAAEASQGLHAYTADIGLDDVEALRKEGVDLEHAIGDGLGETPLSLLDGQADRLRAAGIELRALDVTAPSAASPLKAKRAKPDTGGDSPNPFYDVYRSYSEPGGIYDEMTALAEAHRDVVKKEIVGTSTLGKPIIALKITADARSTPDGTRPAVLYSSNNHAREWIAAETNRRLAHWFVDNKDDPKVAELLRTRELWVMPIQNVDGYNYTFTCGIGAGTAANVPCGGTPLPNGTAEYRDINGVLQTSTNRTWRKTLRDNDANGVYGNSQDGVDPNRNYPAKRGIDEEGASNQFNSETYRGPFALSEPENLAFDRLLRKVRFKANVNYHSAGQLLLTPVSYTTDYAPVDSTLFDAITGTDGDSAVEPYQPQRSSDLYESNGDTIDNGYVNYGVIGWTPELDQCATAGGDSSNSCNQFIFPDDEGKVQAVFEKNLPMALNIAHSLDKLDRPENFDPDPSRYQVKATRDIKATPLDVSYGDTQDIEAITRRSLGPVEVRATISGPGGPSITRTQRANEVALGERYGELKGVYYQRVRTTLPRVWRDVIPAVPGTPTNPNGTPAVPARVPAVGDTVAVQVIAGALRQRFTYRVVALPTDTTKKRVLVIQAEDYTGKSPNVTAGYATAPRYGAQYVASLQAAGYDVATWDVDAPPANAAGTPGTKYPTALGVLDHFDAVVWETGDDLIAQDATETNPRYVVNTTTQGGSQNVADWSHHLMLEVRDFLNTGGKAIVAGRGVHQPFTSTSVSLSATGPYNWAPDPIEFFTYPLGGTGDDDQVGTAFRRYRGISNDTWQNYLGIAGRQGGAGATTGTTGAPNYTGAPVTTAPGGLFAGTGVITVDSTTGNDPNQLATGVPAPQAKTPVRLRTFSSVSANEPLRQERVELDYANAPTAGGGAAISTPDTVTFGFGLEQVDQATRNVLLARSMAYLLPTARDTVAPSTPVFKAPVDSALKNTFDPVEVDVTTADERGDMKEVRLFADGQLVGRAGTFPFQFRWTPGSGAAGRTVTLRAEAEDSAGNVSSATKQVTIAEGTGPAEAPVPVGIPTLSGEPVVGGTLTCTPGAFVNQPESIGFGWLADGKLVDGATAATFQPTAAQQGRAVSCRTRAVNAGGDADADSGTLVIGAATPAPVTTTVTTTTPAPPTPPTTTPTTPTTPPSAGSPTAKVRCTLLAGRRGITCTVTPSRLTAGKALTARVKVKGRKASASRSGTRTFKVTLRTKARLTRSSKAVVSLASDGKGGSLTLKLGKAGTRTLK